MSGRYARYWQPRYQQPAKTEPWETRWNLRRCRALNGGQIDHTPDREAPWTHLAHWGYLVPLDGDALIDYKAYMQAFKQSGAPSDRMRMQFEDWYIRRQQMKRGPRVK